MEAEEPSGGEQSLMTLDDLLNQAKSNNNTPATIDTKTESPVVDTKVLGGPQSEVGQQPKASGVDLGKRRTRNPVLITEIMSKIRQPEHQESYHEQELLMGDSDSDDDNMHDLRSNTQLCNNDSIAQCSQDTYEEQSQQFAIQHQQQVISVQQQ